MSEQMKEKLKESIDLFDEGNRKEASTKVNALCEEMIRDQLFEKESNGSDESGSEENSDQ